MTSSGIEPSTFRLAAQCLNHTNMRQKDSEETFCDTTQGDEETQGDGG
jgi:hypothetical protein